MMRSLRLGTVVNAAAMLALVGVAFGCGMRGPPLPPLVFVPGSVTNLEIERVDNEVFISLEVPSVNSDGIQPADLAHLEIYGLTTQADPERVVFPLPLTEWLEYATLVATIAVEQPDGVSGTDADSGLGQSQLVRQGEEVTVVGAGANPGYIYEVVGLALTGAAWDIESIGVQRVVDLSAFSSGVMRRLGIGYTEDTFADQVRNRAVYGHIGFGHTIHSFATRFGLEIERIEDSIEPILTEHSITSLAVEVAEGESAGLRQRTIGFVEGEPWFNAEFLGHVELDGLGLVPRDTYEISGAPNIRGVIEPGFNPQRTVTAALMNTLPHIVAARPGLISVTDLPIPSPWS